MNLPINLASEPLENLRPLRLAVAAALLSALVIAGALAVRYWRERTEFGSTTAQISRLEDELAALDRQQSELQHTLDTPQARRVRERSAYLNSLIEQKSLSWTRMFMDLEEILPERARIISIKPGDKHAQQTELKLTVAAEEMPPLVEFLKRLEASPHFGSPEVGAQRFPSGRNDDNIIALEITTPYQQGRPGTGDLEAGLSTQKRNDAPLGRQLAAAPVASPMRRD